MKNVFTILLVAAIYNANGQAIIDYNVHAPIKDSIPLFVPGTHVSVFMPADFKIAKELIGIEKDERTYIQVIDPYEGDYKAGSANFTRPMFEGLGMDVFEFKNMQIDGYNARFAGMRNSQGYKKFELLFGDSTFTVLLVGHCSVNDDAHAKEIETAMLSAAYDKTQKINPYVHSYFNVSDSTSAFKFSKMADQDFRYSQGGKIKLDKDDAFVSITPFTLSAPLKDKEVRKTLEDAYKKDGMTGIKFKNETDKKINGYDAYESEVYAKLNGKEVLIYQLTISKDAQALILKGFANSDMESNLAEFKKLAYTINFKPSDK